nr:NADPH oxidoreductase A-like [Lytechinus pictus]
MHRVEMFVAVSTGIAGLSIILWIYIRNILKPSSKYGLNANNFDKYIDDLKLSQEEDDIHDCDTNNGRQHPHCAAGKQILVFYGTEYGFSEEVANILFKRLINIAASADDVGLCQLQPRLLNAKDWKHLRLEDEQLILVIISTSGDGVPPSSTMDWYNSFMSTKFDLTHLQYSVLALGDTNYPHFCRAGRTVYERFCELGACPFIPIANVDMEDWTVINDWMDNIQDYLLNNSINLVVKEDYLSPLLMDEDGFHRLKPFMATLLIKKALTYCDATSDKETIHCEFSIEGSELVYEAGDAVGIYPTNRIEDVQWVLRASGLNGEDTCSVPSAYQPKESNVTLRESLQNYYDLKNIRVSLLQCLLRHADGTVKENLEILMKNGTSRSNQALSGYMEVAEVGDVLEDYPVKLCQEELLANLRPLQPRYYSISSSPILDSNRICVTAAIIRYSNRGRPRVGVATTFLQDRLDLHDLCPVFISPSPDFQLPKDRTKDIIMIGPGTGIAPFRAFIQERVHLGASGMNLLYFGCRHKAKDFLYKKELEKMVVDGHLKLRTAFSRDQEKKVYVQHLIQQDTLMIWNMIQGGAHMYVCGDATHMASDVHEALLTIIKDKGSMSEDDALKYLRTMEENHRYQKDVWVT